MIRVGGGASMTPLQFRVFDFYPIITIGTDLRFAVATITVVTITYGWQGAVQWGRAVLLALGNLSATLHTFTLFSEVTGTHSNYRFNRSFNIAYLIEVQYEALSCCITFLK